MKIRRKIYSFLLVPVIFVCLGFFQQALANDSLGFEYANQLGLQNEAVSDPRELVVDIVQFLLTFLGIIAVAMFLYGGFLWMTSAGSPDRLQKAKKTIISAIIGLIIIISAYSIVALIIRGVNNAVNPACTDGETRVCGCGGTQTCVGGVWGTCLGSNCNFDPGQNAFRINNTVPSDEDSGVPRNINMRAFLNREIDTGMTQAELNENFTVDLIETNVDPGTLVGIPVAPQAVSLLDIALLSGNRTMSALAADGCGNEESTPNCLNEWSRYRVSINDGLSDIITAGPQVLDCNNGLCHFEFITDDSVDTATPTVAIIPTQICQDDGSLEAEANMVGAWARDDVGISEMRFFYNNGSANNLVHIEPGEMDRSQFYEHQYETVGFTVGANYIFTAEADDMAGDTAADSFQAEIRPGHCCNGLLDFDEEDIDCGGMDCESCTMRDPMITFYSPDNGAPGNWITVGGRYFGSTAGEVYFSDGAGAWIGPADFPSAVNANCTDNWSSRQVIVVVPAGAQSGPLRIIRSDGREDYSDNFYGPLLDDFTVNTIERPGLCLANPDSGYYEDTSILEGTGFGANPHFVYFGNETDNIQTPGSAWIDSQVVAAVPNLTRGLTSIFIEAAGEQSNYINFYVLVDESRQPIIDYIDPESGPIGQYVTIYGSNFDSYLSGTSLVEFDDGNTVASADGFDFPEECQNRWWNDTFIIVKVPVGLNLGTAEVRVTNRYNQASDIEEFDVIAGDPSPGICLLDPHNGLLNTAIDIYGDNMGDSPAGGFVRFYNNVDQAEANTNIWENQNVNTNIRVGAETGPLRVSDGNSLSNSLNFTVGPCNDNSDCYAMEECCGSGTAWEGICRPSGSCGLGAAGLTGYGWSFTTGAGNNSATCGGNSSRSSCEAAGTCPNSPGTCQTTADLNLNVECGDAACEARFPLTCSGGNCQYNQITNLCESTIDSCQSTLIGWINSSCNLVRGESVWQVNQPSNCPLGTYLDSNNMCTIGVLGNPSICDTCANGLVCQNDVCIIPRQLCPDNSSCQAGECILDFEICECCCEVGQSERDCCLGLTCTSGGCGDDPAYGQCSGCRVENNGNPNDVSAEEQALSDEACNCEGHSGKYCEINNPADPNDVGACTDAQVCDDDPYTPTCEINQSMCDPGRFCDIDCFCRNATPCDTDNNNLNGCSAANNCNPSTEYCDYTDCFCKPGQSCDGDLSNGVCDANQAMCDPSQTCDLNTCLCVPMPGIPGDPCDRDPLPGAANVNCNMNYCGTGYDCLTYDPANQPCGNCCCDLSLTGTSDDTCLAIDSSLYCSEETNTAGSCYDAAPNDGTDFGICCGCTDDADCGNPESVGCGNDSCCHPRPNVISVFPPDDPVDTDPGDICRNTLIEATFDIPMDISSFSSNVILFGDYGIDQCPAGTTYLSGPNKDFGIFARAYYKTLNKIGKLLSPILSQKFVNAFTPPNASRNYCAVAGSVSGYNNASGGSVMNFSPSSLLDGDRLYYVAIKGDENLNSQSGVRDFYDIALNAGAVGAYQSPSAGANSFNAIFYQNAYIWSFRTMSDLEICEVNRVNIYPSSYLFNDNENSPAENDLDMNDESFDSARDGDKVFVAEALDQRGNRVVSIPGVYEFTWSWTSVSPAIADFVAVNNLPDNQRLIRANANIVDGETIINATVNSGNLSANYTPFSLSGLANVYIFICDNPWPPIDGLGEWRPWRDDTQGLYNCVGGDNICSNMNYEIYYCRDAGREGTYDDLPAINSDNTLNLDETPLSCTVSGSSCFGLQDGDPCAPDNGGVCQRILKESFFFRENTPDVRLITLEGSEEADGNASLYWNNIPPAYIPINESLEGYKIYYGNQPGNYINEIEVDITENHSQTFPYIVSGLQSGRTYYFAITALYVTSAESSLSNELQLLISDTQALIAPVFIDVIPRDSEVQLSWIEVAGASSYRLYYGAVDNTGAPNADRSYGNSQNIGSDTQIIVSGLTNGQTYYFAVTSVDDNGNESVFSNEVSASPAP